MIRVVIVDDSPLVRRVFAKGLSADPDLDVVGVARDAYEARDLIINKKPDVVTLDIEMPKIDGLTFLSKLMKHFPVPVVIVSSLTEKGSDKAMEALNRGAVEVVSKQANLDNLYMMLRELVEKVKAAAEARVGARRSTTHAEPATPQARQRLSIPANRGHVIAMGSSTGGTEALAAVLRQMPANSPGILMVQHMPALFTSSLAERLDKLSPMNIREAKNGDRVESGVGLLAPGGECHMQVKRVGANLEVRIKAGPKVNRHRPSVDVLFRSVAQVVKDKALGAILTGMGDDGAAGLKMMHDAGAFTVAQDEESCVVYGMPAVAARIGAADKIVNINQIPRALLQSMARARV